MRICDIHLVIYLCIYEKHLKNDFAKKNLKKLQLQKLIYLYILIIFFPSSTFSFKIKSVSVIPVSFLNFTARWVLEMNIALANASISIGSFKCS